MKRNRLYPRLVVDTAPVGAVGQAGGALLARAVEVSGLADRLREALEPWRLDQGAHDPAKVLLDLAVACALGGDGASDTALLRSEPQVFGLVASEATVSRTVDRLAARVGKVERAVDRARSAARARVWALAGNRAPGAARSAKDPLVVDLDATLLVAHSDKEQAAGTWKKTYGFHPLCAFVDHGPDGTGEPLEVLLRPGSAGSNTAEDHIKTTREALKQVPGRLGRSVLVRADCAGGTQDFTKWLEARRLSYSVGFVLPFDTPDLLKKVPKKAWTPAVEPGGEHRDGAWVAELTDLLDLEGWPKGMRVIVRRERPHPGAQLRFDDADGYRLTAFATNTKVGQHAALELRHRQRARCEDRIRTTKDTALAKMPYHRFDHNQVWCLVVQLAAEITTWTQTLAFANHPARRWEPKTLRLRVFTIPATLARTARRTTLHLARHNPFAHLAATAWTRLDNLARAPG